MEATSTVNEMPQPLVKDIYTNSNLTKLQMIYWVGQSLRPSSPLFNVIVTFRWQAAVNEQLFAEAFTAVVQQSDALRTIIREEDGVPQRVVLDAVPKPLEILDFSDNSDPEAFLQQWVQVRGQQSFNLSQSAYDIVLIKLASDSYFWFINQHHLVTDAASVFLLYNFVTKLYGEAQITGKLGSAPTLPTFESYVEFEKAFRESPRYGKSAVFWQKQLEDGLEPLRFYGRIPKKKSHNMQRVTFPLDQERSQQLKAAMERPGVIKMTHDLGMLNVLLTLYFAQLHNMTGNHRLATMMPFHNRPTESMKKTIGLLMEISPLLVTLEEGETFASLTKKVSKSLQRALLHYQYGTAVAMQNNLQDLMFNYHHRPELRFGETPVQQELIHPNAGSDSFALHIHEFENDGALTFFFDFHEDVFTPAERQHTLAIFEKLLTAYLADTDVPLAELNLPTDISLSSKVEGQKADGISSKTAVFTPPRDELEQQLATVWQKVLGIDTISIHDDFFDLGGNSWMAVRLFTELQAVTGKNLPLATLFQAPTVATLAARLRQGDQADSWTSIVPIKTSGTKPPYFCIHGVTGDILWLKDLADLMDEDQPFYGIQARGLDGEAAPFNNLDEMAAHYLQQIRQVQPEGPYYLGGYCMGGDIAYEVARQIKASGDDVPVLTVIDPPPADLSERAPLNGRFLINFVQNTPRWLREFLRLGGGEIFARVRRKGRWVLRALWQKTQTNGVEPGMSATDVIDQADDLPEHRQQLIEAHLHALMNYNHPGYDGDVIVYEAKSRPLLNPGNHALEWVEYVKRPITIRTVSGSHSSILHKPHVINLARDLQKSLDEARQNLVENQTN